MTKTKNHLSPHDRFIRAMMTNPQVIQEFFQENLPATIKKLIDFRAIVPQKESFIDDDLRLQIADLLYSVPLNGEKGYLYLLMEHTSSPHRLLPLRMLKYVLAVIDHHLKKEKTQKLPLVYPLILYSGKKAYPFSVDFFDLFEDQKKVAQDIFLKPFHLIDLSQVNDVKLEQYQWFGLMALLAKHIHDPHILPFFQGILGKLRILEAQGELGYIRLIISYVMEAGKEENTKAFLEVIKKGFEKGEEIMTIAERLRQEGFEKGILEGKQEGKLEEKLETALSLLKLGIPQETIRQATHLSFEQIADLRQKILN